MPQPVAAVDRPPRLAHQIERLEGAGAVAAGGYKLGGRVADAPVAQPGAQDDGLGAAPSADLSNQRLGAIDR